MSIENSGLYFLQDGAWNVMLAITHTGSWRVGRVCTSSGLASSRYGTIAASRQIISYSSHIGTCVARAALRWPYLGSGVRLRPSRSETFRGGRRESACAGPAPHAGTYITEAISYTDIQCRSGLTLLSWAARCRLTGRDSWHRCDRGTAEAEGQ